MESMHRNRIRLDLEQELVSLNNSARICRLPIAGPDENELASRMAEQNLDNMLYSRLCRRMDALRAAIRRLDVNDYGVCALCGEKIAQRRLLAAPTVTLCVQCQEELEEGALAAENRRQVTRGARG